MTFSMKNTSNCLLAFRRKVPFVNECSCFEAKVWVVIKVKLSHVSTISSRLVSEVPNHKIKIPSYILTQLFLLAFCVSLGQTQKQHKFQKHKRCEFHDIINSPNHFSPSRKKPPSRSCTKNNNERVIFPFSLHHFE